jgi:hypothetical protein
MNDDEKNIDAPRVNKISAGLGKDNATVRCAICHEPTTILESLPLMNWKRQVVARICLLCDADLQSLEAEE